MTDAAADNQQNAASNHAPLFQVSDPSTNNTIDLDDLFNDIYYMDLPGGLLDPTPVTVPSDTSAAADPAAAAPLPELPPVPVASMAEATAPAMAAAPTTVPAPEPASPEVPDGKATVAPVATAATATVAPAAAEAAAAAPQVTVAVDDALLVKKRSAEEAGLKHIDSTNGGEDAAAGGPGAGKDLTEQQKIERRERNREHAKRSRLRKKFLLESLQEQIHGLEEQIDKLKNAIKTELPAKAEQIITDICGDKEKFTPLPMPSGFGPVKTLMEPDFRLMSALSGSQQNFAISDPTLPDNPIVYVSQGFLDLTGYTLDQVLGRNCRFLQGPGTDQSAVEVIRRGIKEGVDTSVCLLNYRADGTPFWNQFFVAALRDAENNIVNYVGVQCEVSKAVVEKHMAGQKKAAEAEGEAKDESDIAT